MTKEVRFPRDKANVAEFEHPNGETGILIGFRSTGKEIADAFDIQIPVDSNDPDDLEYKREELEKPVVFPMKHKADGATNFEEYEYDDDEIVLTLTDEQYEQTRRYFKHTLIP